MTDDKLNAAIAEVLTAVSVSMRQTTRDRDLSEAELAFMRKVDATLIAVASGALIPKEAADAPRFPDHMAQIVAMKTERLPARIATLVTALQAIPDYMKQYQWQADEKQAFGSKWVRAIAGDNGKGMGRQAIAEVVGHLNVADFIAAANPDTISLLLSELTTAQQAASNADAQAGALLREAARYAAYLRDYGGLDQDGNPYLPEDAHLHGCGVANEIEAHILSIAPDATAALEHALVKAREVKPLVWTVRHHQQYEIWSAGDYDVWVASDYHRLEGAGDDVLLFPNLEAAKAAAQADYAARVTSALMP